MAMRNPIMRLIHTWLLLALGVLASAHIVPGIHYDTVPTLIVVVILLSLLNAFLKPLLLLFTLPFIVLTMGLGILFINALLFLLVGALVEGFHVAGFWAAFLGGLIISVVSFLINSLFGPPPRSEGGGRTPPKRRLERNDDVIDI
jgi:putative membrane protein